MVEVHFYPLDISTRIVAQKPAVVLHGRTISGERISVIDNSYLPCFYVVPRESDTAKLEAEILGLRIKERDDYYSVMRVEKKTMKLFEKETPVLKLYVNNPYGISHIIEELSKRTDIKGIYEHDIPFLNNYLLDKKIVPAALTSVEGEIINSYSKVPVLRADSIVQEEDDLIKHAKILAFDIETYEPIDHPGSPEHDPIIMVSFYSDNFKKTITWKKFATNNQSIEFVQSELELLNRFKKVIDEFQPDLLVGYSSDDFAFPYIKKRADKYGLPLDLGVDHSIAAITNDETSIKGIVHADIHKFISNVLGSKIESETFTLGEIAQELIGEGKKQINVAALASTWDNNPEQLEPYCEYTLQDAVLIYKLTEKIMPFVFEFIKLTNLDIFDVIRGNYSQFVEAFLIKESKFMNELIPSRPTRDDYEQRKSSSPQSGLILEPKEGIYNNVLVYDFKSLYPSIISTHNISPGTLRCMCCNEKVPEEEMHFCKNNTGFFPRLLGALIDRRQRVLKILKDESEKSFEQHSLLSARQEALKMMANSLYGYFGYPSSRWHNSFCARAVTAYGRHYLNFVIDKAKDSGFDVLYADADSVFLKLGSKKIDAAEKFFEELNSSLPEKMNLDYEGFFPRGVFVSSKTSSKKKYALLSEKGFLKIKGLESSRRNFSSIAKEVQEKVLYLILKERKLRGAMQYVQQVIEEIKAGTVPMRKMIIYTQLQRNIKTYETIAPHVAVAQKMEKQGFNVAPGSIIQYIVAKGEGSIAEKAQMPNEVKEYDSDYYIDNQIVSSVEKIFEAAGVDFRKALNEKEQANLSEFI